jgi:hypothetical protein
VPSFTSRRVFQSAIESSYTNFSVIDRRWIAPA